LLVDRVVVERWSIARARLPEEGLDGFVMAAPVALEDAFDLDNNSGGG